MRLSGRRKRIQRESGKNPLGRTAKRRDSREERLCVTSDAPRPRSPSSRTSYSSCIVSPLRGRIPWGSVIRCYKHNCLLARDQPRAFELNGCRAGRLRKKIAKPITRDHRPWDVKEANNGKMLSRRTHEFVFTFRHPIYVREMPNLNSSNSNSLFFC